MFVIVPVLFVASDCFVDGVLILHFFSCARLHLPPYIHLTALIVLDVTTCCKIHMHLKNNNNSNRSRRDMPVECFC